MIFSFIVFFIFTTVSFMSIVGYGSLFSSLDLKNKWIGNSIFFFLGLIFLNIIGIIFYYLNINYKIFNLIIILSGLFFFRKIFDRKIIISYILLNLILFSCILISKLHEDWSYHFGFIEQIVNHNPIIGIGNVEDIHVLSTSFFSFVQKLFVLPFYEFNFIFIPVYLVFFNIISLLLNLILTEKKKIIFIFIMIFTLMVVKLTRISEFGYDYISNFILIYIIVIYMLTKTRNLSIENSSLFFLILFLFSISIKVSSILFIPIFLYIFFEDFKKNKFIKEKKILLISSVFILCFILENFLRSGCILYFFETSCFNQKFVSWTIDYQRVKDHSLHVELWTKGFYHQDLILDKNNYLEFSNWFKNWVNIHFFYKIIEFLIIPILIFGFAIFFKKENNINKKSIIFFIATLISIILWLFLLPQLRFGSGIIVTFIISIMYLIINVNEDLEINKKYIIIFVISCFAVLNIKNAYRINDEFTRDDKHKFTNFPFPPKNRLKSIIIDETSTKYMLVGNKKFKKKMWFNIVY